MLVTFKSLGELIHRLYYFHALRLGNTSRFLINDTYRSDICLLYPPHLIAIAALYLTCVLQPSVRQANADWQTLQKSAMALSQTRRSSRNVTSASKPTSNPSSKTTTTTNDTVTTGSLPPNKTIPQDFVGFFADLNVNMRMVATIAQEMIDFYALCDKYKEEFNPSQTIAQVNAANMEKLAAGNVSFRRNQKQAQSIASSASRSDSRTSSATPGGSGEGVSPNTSLADTSTEVNSMVLLALLDRMQVMRQMDLISNPYIAVNKMLERAQAAG